MNLTTPMTLEELTTPTDHTMVLLDRWWLIQNGKPAFYGKSYMSPQCNSDKRIVSRFGDGEILFIPVAYIPHHCNDYM